MAAAEKVHVPEVIEADSALPADLVALRRFAWYLDEAFEVPGTRMRIGFSAVIGLVPGIGDLVGGILSTWIIAGALRHRVPPWIIIRMVANVAIDMIFGAVPVAGDLFDFLYEENMRNMRLLEAHRNRRKPPRSAASIALILALIIGFIILLALVLLAVLIAAILWVIGQRPWV